MGRYSCGLDNDEMMILASESLAASGIVRSKLEAIAEKMRQEGYDFVISQDKRFNNRVSARIDISHPNKTSEEIFQKFAEYDKKYDETLHR